MELTKKQRTELPQKPTRYGTNSQGVFTNQIDGAYVSYLDFVGLVEALESAQQHIAELESRTVKLPQAVSAGGQGYQEQVERILTAAGIKWEVE